MRWLRAFALGMAQGFICSIGALIVVCCAMILVPAAMDLLAANRAIFAVVVFAASFLLMLALWRLCFREDA